MKIYRSFIPVFYLFILLFYKGKALGVEAETSLEVQRITVSNKNNEDNFKKDTISEAANQQKRAAKNPDREETQGNTSNSTNDQSKKSTEEEIKGKVSNMIQEINFLENPKENLKEELFESESSPQETPLMEENKNTVSETFAPRESEKEEDFDFISSFEDYSWVFDSKKTSQELAIIPMVYMSRTYGFNWGLRLFTFSPDNKGYYFSTSVTNQVFSSLFKWDVSYRQANSEIQETRAYGQFSNYFEPYYPTKGMDTLVKDEKKLYTYRLNFNYQRLFKEFYPFFFGGEAGTSFLKERKPYINDEITFQNEFLIYLKLKGGYDSQDNWKNPSSGQFHQLSLACVPILNENNSYCLADADLRAYIPIHIKSSFLKNSVLALRGFAGTSLMAVTSYSTSYRLGGSHVLRGFTANRFWGDKVYFGQTELRTPLWKDIISGVLFFELGEAAKYGKSFSGFLWDYGLGLRFGFPPSYDIKFRVDLGFSTDKEGKHSYNLIMNFFQAF